MERLLAHDKRKWRSVIIATIVMMLIAFTVNASVSAATHSGNFTGYAMGNQYGGSGVQVSQGHFANHPCSGKCNDPAQCWTWGTRIYNTPSISMHYGNGNTISYSAFYLEDNGDIYCTEGNYWVDVYFGRYRWAGQSCNCPGSPSPGYCVNAYANSCDDANGFGTHYYTYSGP